MSRASSSRAATETCARSGTWRSAASASSNTLPVSQCIAAVLRSSTAYCNNTCTKRTEMAGQALVSSLITRCWMAANVDGVMVMRADNGPS